MCVCVCMYVCNYDANLTLKAFLIHKTFLVLNAKNSEQYLNISQV